MVQYAPRLRLELRFVVFFLQWPPYLEPTQRLEAASKNWTAALLFLMTRVSLFLIVEAVSLAVSAVSNQSIFVCEDV